MEDKVLLTAEQAMAISRVLAQPRRMEILRQVAAGGCTPCSAVQANHAVSAATLSHHVSELTEAGLVEARREGKYVLLSLRREVWEGYLRYLREI